MILSMVKVISSSKSGNYNNSSLHLQVSDGLFIPWCSEVLSSSRRDTCSVRSVSSPFVTAAVLSSSDSIVHALLGALYLECNGYYSPHAAVFNLTLIKRILFPVKREILR